MPQRAHHITRHSQRGIGYIVGIAMVLTFIFMVALVVDIGRVEIFLRMLQASADGTALAGADRLRSGGPKANLNEDAAAYRIEKHKGFRRAKEAVLASLDKSPLVSRYGSFIPTSSSTCADPFPSGFTSPDFEFWSCLEHQFGTSPQFIQVRIERGLYYEKVSGADKTPTFLNLEPMFQVSAATTGPERNICALLAQDSGVPASNFFPVRCGGSSGDAANTNANWRTGEQEPPMNGNIWPNWRYSPYTIANAVRVKIAVTSMPTLLANFGPIGLQAFGGVKARETIASKGIARDQGAGGTTDPW
jgi:hypothetical protein